MHRTSILLPLDLKASAEAQARKQGISLGELIRRKLGKSSKPKKVKSRHDDPVFLYYAKVRTAPGLANLKNGVINHDKYIAESLKAEMRRWKATDKKK